MSRFVYRVYYDERNRSISWLFEMSQFWQNLHARLQPAVPKDNTLDRG